MAGSLLNENVIQNQSAEVGLEYVPSADQGAPYPVRHAVIVVGAGPVGLAAAIDLAQHGVSVVLLDDDNRLSTGSRAICFAKRTLEIFDRLGCGETMLTKGVSWNVGKVFFHDEQIYSFNLLPEAGYHYPAFINLQQYYVEGFLLDRARQLQNLDIRWKNKITGLTQAADGVKLAIETPDGPYELHCDYLIAADGARSPIRAAMGLESKGQIFRDRFLTADVKMAAEFPSERWFWFDPPFHRNQSVLLHRQPDDVWRIDSQLGWDADPVLERQPERVIPRVKALLVEDVDFTLEWVSVYAFACLRMEKFRHGRVIFAGDSAHGVSPFGARGANSGIQDADNLVWKLKLVLDGKAPDILLDCYASEREYAADENILNSTRATDFITPKNDISRSFRDAVLLLAKDCAFARGLVNSSRLSVPATLANSPLNTPDQDRFNGLMVPGAPSCDAPVRVGGEDSWFLEHVGGGFTGIYFSDGGELSDAQLAALRVLEQGSVSVRPVMVEPRCVTPRHSDNFSVIEDAEGLLAKRFDAQPGTFYLVRPDQHVCARWRHFEPDAVRSAVRRATANV